MAGRKRSNGEGSISYDKRRKRYRVKVTVGWELNEKTGRVKQITQDLGSSYKTQGEAARALAEYKARPYDLADKNITFSQLYERWFDDFIKEHESHRYRIKSAYKYCSSLYNKKAENAEQALEIAKEKYHLGEFVLEPGELQSKNIAVLKPETIGWEEF